MNCSKSCSQATAPRREETRAHLRELIAAAGREPRRDHHFAVVLAAEQRLAGRIPFP